MVETEILVPAQTVFGGEQSEAEGFACTEAVAAENGHGLDKDWKSYHDNNPFSACVEMDYIFNLERPIEHVDRIPDLGREVSQCATRILA